MSSEKTSEKTMTGEEEEDDGTFFWWVFFVCLFLFKVLCFFRHHGDMLGKR